ncbi:MAG: hypothetical protein QY871_00470 [Dehalococcoides mccartyi]|uniref:hypothetical protein n=1 Tax=Dehalococcoides mccartyi TaxID=61435 RepID=UPI0025C9C5D8|nr:hypothetical protein [Dehalococcoides mccartyi]MDN4185541.1 hypothetical protein [Dehalococcoides mccartyi]
MNFRNFLTIFFFIFFLVWCSAVVYWATNYGLDTMEALGIGASIGYFLKMIGDAWQFYFRKKPSADTTNVIK